MPVLRVVKYLVIAIALIPIVIGAIGGMNAGNESEQLKNFCTRFPSDTSMEKFRAAAIAEGFLLFDQADAANDSKESQIAAKLIKNAMNSKWTPSGQLAAIVRKPGIGYYACLVNYDGKALLKTEYIWND